MTFLLGPLRDVFSLVCTGYQASFSFNLVDILQTQGDHIAKCIGACREKDAVMDASEESEEWWVQQVIANRGKSNYAKNCTPGCKAPQRSVPCSVQCRIVSQSGAVCLDYNFEGQEQRRQDGNFNGGVLAYYEHVNAVGDNLDDNFDFS